MLVVLLTIHLIAFAIALGGRILFIPTLSKSLREELSDRLEGVFDSLEITKWADLALLASLITGILILMLLDQPVASLHWALKVKLILVFLLFIDLGAFYLAQSRIINHYDKQMIPAISRLNRLAVIFMCCMVFFASFYMN
jgi:hypothetical protein